MKKLIVIFTALLMSAVFTVISDAEQNIRPFSVGDFPPFPNEELVLYADDNPYYTIVDGIFYSKDMQTLRYCPPASAKEKVVISATVKSVADKAFSDCKNIKTLCLSEGLERIGNEAFSGCIGLKTVFIPRGVSVIGENAFMNTPELEKFRLMGEGENTYLINDMLCCVNRLIRLPPKSKTKSVVMPDDAGYYVSKGSVFQDCVYLRELVIKDGVWVGEFRINDFEGCSNLERVYIPDDPYNSLHGIVNIYRCNSKILTVYSPDDDVHVLAESKAMSVHVRDYNEYMSITQVLDFGYNIGKDVDELSYDYRDMLFATVHPDNPYFTSYDGIVYSKDMKTLIFCPKSYKSDKIVIPDGVEVIKEKAFLNCNSISEVVLPDSIKVIEFDAFGASTLTKINLPEGLADIEAYAFRNCDMLTELIFPDSLSESIDDEEADDDFEYYPCETDMFYGCKNLKTVRIPCNGLFRFYVIDYGGESYANFGNSFVQCDNIENFIIGDNVTDVMIYDNALVSSDLSTVIKLPHNAPNESFTVPAETKYIDGGAFSNCENLKELIILTEEFESVCYYLGENWLLKGTDLHRLYIQSNSIYGFKLKDFPNLTVYTSEGSSADEYFKNLGFPVVYVESYEDYLMKRESGEISYIIGKDVSEINPSEMSMRCSYATVHPDNPCFTQVDGVVYSKDMKTLVWCPARYGEDEAEFLFVAPETVEKISDYAFSNCLSIEYISMTKSVKEIGKGAFEECGALNIYLDTCKNLRYIGDRAFYNCKNLRSLYIPETVVGTGESGGKSWGVDMLYGCDGLESLTVMCKLPVTYKEDENGYYDFDSAFNTADKIFFSEDNPYVITDGAVIATPDMKAILRTLDEYEDRSDGKSFVIPSCTEALGKYALCSTYKKEIIIEPYDGDGERKILLDGKYVSVWIDRIFIPEDVDITNFSTDKFGSTIIYTTEESNAHKYCAENGFPYVIVDSLEDYYRFSDIYRTQKVVDNRHFTCTEGEDGYYKIRIENEKNGEGGCIISYNGMLASHDMRIISSVDDPDEAYACNSPFIIPSRAEALGEYLFRDIRNREVIIEPYSGTRERKILINGYYVNSKLERFFVPEDTDIINFTTDRFKSLTVYTTDGSSTHKYCLENNVPVIIVENLSGYYSLFEENKKWWKIGEERLVCSNDVNGYYMVEVDEDDENEDEYMVNYNGTCASQDLKIIYCIYDTGEALLCGDAFVIPSCTEAIGENLLYYIYNKEIVIEPYAGDGERKILIYGQNINPSLNRIFIPDDTDITDFGTDRLKNLTVYTTDGSSAHEYCINNNFPFEIVEGYEEYLTLSSE